MQKSTGLRHAPHKYCQLGAPHPVSEPLPYTLPISLRHFWPLRLDQNRTNSCPAGGSAPAIYVACASSGKPLGFYPSERGIYGDVRALETPGIGMLPDEGADCVDLVQSLATFGIRAMDPLVTPTGEQYDIWPGNVNLRPNAAEDFLSRQHLVFNVQRLDTAQPNFADHVCAALQSGYPVGFAIHATPFEKAWDLGKTAPVLTDTTGATDDDWHWVCCLDARQGETGIEFWLLTSWGPDGGEDGGVWVSAVWLQAMCGLALIWAVTIKESA